MTTITDYYIFTACPFGSVGTLEQTLNSPGWGIVGGINGFVRIYYVTQNSSYVQLLATLCIIVI